MPTDVPFTVPKSYCTDMTDLKEEYETCQKEDETIMTSQKICEVKSVPSCKSEVVKKVIRSTWESCHKLIQNAIYGLDIDTYFCTLIDIGIEFQKDSEISIFDIQRLVWELLSL